MLGNRPSVEGSWARGSTEALPREGASCLPGARWGPGRVEVGPRSPAGGRVPAPAQWRGRGVVVLGARGRGLETTVTLCAPPTPRRLERAAHRLLLPPLHRREGRHPPGHRAARAPQQRPQRGRGRHLRQVGTPARPLCRARRLHLGGQQESPRTKARVAQRVKRLPAARETQVRSLGQEDPLEKTTHCSILAWRIPWMEEPGGLQSMGSLRVRHH